jgi:hypothetical protein
MQPIVSLAFELKYVDKEKHFRNKIKVSNDIFVIFIFYCQYYLNSVSHQNLSHVSFAEGQKNIFMPAEPIFLPETPQIPA